MTTPGADVPYLLSGYERGCWNAGGRTWDNRTEAVEALYAEWMERL